MPDDQDRETQVKLTVDLQRSGDWRYFFASASGLWEQSRVQLLSSTVKLSEQQRFTATAWASWGASLPCGSASSICNHSLGSAGLWKAKWYPQSFLSILSHLCLSRHLGNRPVLHFQEDVKKAGLFKIRGWAQSSLLRCVCLGLTNSGFPLQAQTFFLKAFEFQLWIPAASISGRQILSQIPVVLV